MHGGRHIHSPSGVLTTKEWRDGKKKRAMERALRTRSCRQARAGFAKLRLRRSATRCLARSQHPAMRSAVEQPPANAADGIIAQRYCFALRQHCPAVAPLWSFYIANTNCTIHCRHSSCSIDYACLIQHHCSM